MKFTVIFDRLATVEVEAESIEEAREKAEDILDNEPDLEWTEADIKDIEEYE